MFLRYNPQFQYSITYSNIKIRMNHDFFLFWTPKTYFRFFKIENFFIGDRFIRSKKTFLELNIQSPIIYIITFIYTILLVENGKYGPNSHFPFLISSKVISIKERPIGFLGYFRCRFVWCI